MVDIETTGLDPNKNAIIQIGAIAFDLNNRFKSKDGFNMCLTIPSDREWNIQTAQWWNETNPNVLYKINKNATNFMHVLLAFKSYVESFDDDILFWSNHPFDWGFLNNYFVSYGIKRPYKYDSFRDVDTYIVAMVGEKNIKKYKPVADKAQEHDALYDCMLQIEWLIESIKNKG